MKITVCSNRENCPFDCIGKDGGGSKDFSDYKVNFVGYEHECFRTSTWVKPIIEGIYEFEVDGDLFEL